MARISIHDPIFESDPKLRALKRQLPIAVVLFVIGTSAFGPMLGWALSQEPRSTLGIAGSVLVFVVCVGNFVRVTWGMVQGAKKARRKQAKAHLAHLLPRD